VGGAGRPANSTHAPDKSWTVAYLSPLTDMISSVIQGSAIGPVMVAHDLSPYQWNNSKGTPAIKKYFALL